MMLSERYTVHPKIVSETIDGEVIILNLDRGRYYSLTMAGTDAWSAFGRAASGEEVVAELLARYEGERKEVERAVHALIAELRQEELILPLPAGAPAPASEGAPLPDGTATSRPVFQAPALQTYTDMEALLLLDPIHEVDETGWPHQASPERPPA